MRRRATGLILLLLSATAGGALADCPSPPERLLFIRHAEKQDDSADSPLTPCGWQQAAALVELLGNEEIGTLFISSRTRTRQTALPLAEYKGLEPAAVFDDDRQGTDRLIEAVCTVEDPSRTVLVVGHSHTLPEVLSALGVENPGLRQAEVYAVEPGVARPTRIPRRGGPAELCPRRR